MTAFLVCAADSGHTIQKIIACKKMFTNIHDTIKIELTILISILFIVNITEISKMFLKNGM